MLAVAMLGSSSAVTVLAETLQEAAVQEEPTVQDNAAPVSEEGSAEKDTAEQQPAQTGDSTSAGETADSDEGMTRENQRTYRYLTAIQKMYHLRQASL